MSSLMEPLSLSSRAEPPLLDCAEAGVNRDLEADCCVFLRLDRTGRYMESFNILAGLPWDWDLIPCKTDFTRGRPLFGGQTAGNSGL